MEAGCDHTAAPAIRRQRRMDVQRGHRDVSPRPEHASSPRPRRQTWPTRKRPPFRPLGHGKGVRRHQEKEEPLPPRERRGAPQDGDPSPQAQATVTDTSGSGTPASECSQVKVARVHWFSCTPSAIAKTWVRTLVVLILTVGLIVLLLIFANQTGLIRLK